MGSLRATVFLGLLLFVVEHAKSLPASDSRPGSQEGTSGSLIKEIPQSFLEKLVEGETKEKVEALFAADLQYLKQLDDVDKVKQDIYEAENEIKFKEDYFKKMTDTRLMAREYFAKMEQNYKKYEDLKKDEESWNSVEGSIPNTRWGEMESGSDVLQSVQLAKKKVQSQMKELKPEHDVYESKKSDIEREKETPEETRQKVYETTLNDLNSHLQRLVEDKDRLEDNLEKNAALKEKAMLAATQSWINTKKSNWEKFKGMVENMFSNKEDNIWTFKTKLFPIPSLIRGELEHGFVERVRDLVYKYETRINGDMEQKPEDDDITKRNKEINMDKTKYRMDNNILDGDRYALTPFKHSENPMRRENALLGVIEEIIAQATTAPNKKRDKDLAKEIIEKTKLLVSFIANNNACNVRNKNFSLDQDTYNTEIERVLNAFESAARDLVMVQAVDAENERRKREEVDKRLRAVQEMMNDVSGLVSCVQTLMRIEKTIEDAEAWKAKL